MILYFTAQGRASSEVWELEVNLRKQRISLPLSQAPTHKLQCEHGSGLGQDEWKEGEGSEVWKEQQGHLKVTVAEVRDTGVKDGAEVSLQQVALHSLQ